MPHTHHLKEDWHQKLSLPKILGILNITEDSFSDGGLYIETAQAKQHALSLKRDGADILDIGAASSHPHAPRIPFSLEIRAYSKSAR